MKINIMADDMESKLYKVKEIRKFKNPSTNLKTLLENRKNLSSPTEEEDEYLSKKG